MLSNFSDIDIDFLASRALLLSEKPFATVNEPAEDDTFNLDPIPQVPRLIQTDGVSYYFSTDCVENKAPLVFFIDQITTLVLQIESDIRKVENPGYFSQLNAELLLFLDKIQNNIATRPIPFIVCNRLNSNTYISAPNEYTAEKINKKYNLSTEEDPSLKFVYQDKQTTIRYKEFELPKNENEEQATCVKKFEVDYAISESAQKKSRTIIEQYTDSSGKLATTISHLYYNPLGKEKRITKTFLSDSYFIDIFDPEKSFSYLTELNILNELARSMLLPVVNDTDGDFIDQAVKDESQVSKHDLIKEIDAFRTDAELLLEDVDKIVDKIFCPPKTDPLNVWSHYSEDDIKKDTPTKKPTISDDPFITFIEDELNLSALGTSNLPKQNNSFENNKEAEEFVNFELSLVRIIESIEQFSSKLLKKSANEHDLELKEKIFNYALSVEGLRKILNDYLLAFNSDVLVNNAQNTQLNLNDKQSGQAVTFNGTTLRIIKMDTRDELDYSARVEFSQGDTGFTLEFVDIYDEMTILKYNMVTKDFDFPQRGLISLDKEGKFSELSDPD